MRRNCGSKLLQCYRTNVSYNKTTASTLVPKDCNEELARAYEYQQVEAGWYEWWEQLGLFAPNPTREAVSTPVFSTILPPPNITGTLHLGHALTCSVQDALMRWHRMHGEQVVWLPGTDHAGIATQAVVEKHLQLHGGSTRQQLGRERFTEEVWRWKNDKGGTIRHQLRQVGASLDWSREFFTLDSHQSAAVKEAFIRLFDAGLVYRANSLVSWSCALQSAIADVEVDWMELTGPTKLTLPGYEKSVEFGLLAHVALPLASGDGELVVATTRVETMLGDVAVAVHPTDERYGFLVGQRVRHPLQDGVTLPIIADYFVDPDFGTGAVKITPAHDSADHEVAKRHELPSPNVILENGCISNDFEEFSGMKRFDARQVMTQRLDQMGLLRKIAPHPTKVPLCSRSGDVVEFLLKPQWFIRCHDMAERATRAVKEGNLDIDPPMFEKVWFDWLGNIRDWCVSRQLWWGHRIPAYRCSLGSEEVWVAAQDEAEAKIRAAPQLAGGVNPAMVSVHQDPDVLDTWFSSALLPLSALGWPENSSPDLKRFAPLSMLETGHDILFFWVARMVMLCTQLSGKLPFQKVLLHGIVCDAHGRKMSKSLGNVIHPEDVVHGVSLNTLMDRTQTAHKQQTGEKGDLAKSLLAQRIAFPDGIPACGTDALRFTLCSHNLKAHFVNFDISECYTNRLFCNKVWQASRYILGVLEKSPFRDAWEKVDENKKRSLMDRWILSRLAVAVQQVEIAMSNANFYVATSAIKTFLYSELCDVYLETSKMALKDSDNAPHTLKTLLTCLDTGLRLLAPFMPFLSEELYQHLPERLRLSISIHQTNFPTSAMWSVKRDKECERQVQLLLDAVSVIRRLKNAAKISKHKTKVFLEVSGHEEAIYVQNQAILKTLAVCAELEVGSKTPLPSTSEAATPTCLVHLLGQHGNNEDSSRKQKKLQKELQKLISITTSQGFLEKASPAVQESYKNKIQQLQAKLEKMS